MKFSKKWLQEWVKQPLETEELLHQLTMAGLEVESVEPVAGDFSQVVVAEVLEVTRHPDADRLRVCQVNNGAEILNIVCGAQNVRAGLKVPLAQIGARLPGNIKIRKGKIRGVESQGMICSEAELGLAEASQGIMELLGTAPVGMDFRQYLDLDDVSIHVSLTPNRGDCLSLLGLAREVAALNKAELSMPRLSAIAPASDAVFPVSVSAKQACPRYVGRVIRNIHANSQTPVWMREKLRRSGIRLVSAIVDITNYVMLELGQPLHAFDLDKLTQGIEVRQARTGEVLSLLNGDTVELQANTLIIADAKGPLAIAGVMGGSAAGCEAETRHVFLESAFFTPAALAGKARQYGLHTDSSHRFERGVDPELQLRALERATELVLEIAGGEAGAVIEEIAADALPSEKTIHLNPKKIHKILGLTLENHVIQDLLQRLHFHIQAVEQGWKVRIPSFRFDLNMEVDLIEEIARMHGYNQIPLNYPQYPLAALSRKETHLCVEQIRERLVALGYQEAFTYSFVEPQLQKLVAPDTEALALANPIAADMAVMRTTLWVGLLQALLYNQHRQQKRLRLFEIGQRFVPDAAALKQQQMLAGIISDSALPEQWGVPARQADFFDLKGDLQALLEMTGRKEAYQFVKARHPALHPEQAASVIYNRNKVGWIGALHPYIQQHLKCGGPVLLFEIQLDALLHSVLPSYAPISRFPAIRRDLALVLDVAVSADTVEQLCRNVAGTLLTDFKIFDVYTGRGVPNGKKSLAIALTLQHQERTLVDEEINALMDNVVSTLNEKVQATLRN